MTASPTSTGSRHLTVGSLWAALREDPLTEAVLGWPPDVAAFTSVLVERSQAFRFVLSPPDGGSWPPNTSDPWPVAVAGAASASLAAVGDTAVEVPGLVVEAWRRIVRHAGTPIDDLVTGRAWDLCEAVLVLHAVADEACAGSASRRSSASSPAELAFLGRGRELLARTGSLARSPTDRVRVLPRVRTATCGITHRSLSRYTSVRTDGMRLLWHKASVRRSGDEALRHANLLLLPWPLVIRERDFRPLAGSVRRPEREPFGLFEFAPGEPIDLDLVDRLLGAAREGVDQVDAVVLPECAAAEHELPHLEAVLARHRTPLLIAGTRVPAVGPDGSGGTPCTSACSSGAGGGTTGRPSTIAGTSMRDRSCSTTSAVHCTHGCGGGRPWRSPNDPCSSSSWVTASRSRP